MGGDVLSYVLGDEAARGFFHDAYEQRSLIGSAGSDPGRFQRDVVSIPDVDRLVMETDLKENDLLMADAARGGIDSSEYLDDQGFVDRGAVARLYRSGATIIINQAQRFLPGLARLCEGLEHSLSSHIQTNLYLTPPDAQGFPSHYDNHDVFVVQVEGSKRWRLYGTPVHTPYRGEHYESAEHERGEISEHFTLPAGACVYLPRGLMHDADTSEAAQNGPSLHIAVGVIARTWADLMLEAVADVALRVPEFRRALPPGHARQDFDRTEARALFARLADTLSKEAKLDPALELMADTFVKTRPARAAGRIAGLATGDDAQFVAAPWCQRRWREAEGRLVVAVPGGQLELAPSARSALERALNGRPFVRADLAEGAAKDERVLDVLLDYGLVRPIF